MSVLNANGTEAKAEHPEIKIWMDEKQQLHCEMSGIPNRPILNMMITTAHQNFLEALARAEVAQAMQKVRPAPASLLRELKG